MQQNVRKESKVDLITAEIRLVYIYLSNSMSNFFSSLMG